MDIENTIGAKDVAYRARCPARDCAKKYYIDLALNPAWQCSNRSLFDPSQVFQVECGQQKSDNPFVSCKALEDPRFLPNLVTAKFTKPFSVTQKSSKLMAMQAIELVNAMGNPTDKSYYIDAFIHPAWDMKKLRNSTQIFCIKVGSMTAETKFVSCTPLHQPRH